tara:strand:- start:499 stop:702 length:204 start_codon:yes stop_codon:yes gene_type:complete
MIKWKVLKMIKIQDTMNAIIDKAETSVENLLQQYESKHNDKEFAQAFERLRRGNLKHFNRLRRDIEL